MGYLEVDTYRTSGPPGGILAPGPQIALLIFAALLLLPWLGLTWFNSKGEPREAIVAVSMLQSGDWVLPLSYGADMPFKPPMLAWLIALLAKVFNGGVVNEYISRLPSALGCIAMVWGGYRWSARVRGERFAFIMGIVTLTSVEVLRAAIACRLDMVLTAAMVLAMYQLYRLLNPATLHRMWRYAAVVVLLTVATLTKGPIGCLLPCLCMGIYYLLMGQRFWPTVGRLSAVCVASLVLPAWWFWAAAGRGGDGFVTLMMEENIGRLTGTMTYESHVKPFWYNFVTLLAGMAPWTLLALLALGAWRRLEGGITLRRTGLMALVVTVVTIIFYCIPSSKRSVYLLPVYPMLAYGVATLICSLDRSKLLRVFVWILAVAAVVVPAAVGVMARVDKGVVLWPLQPWMWGVLAVPVLAGVFWLFNRSRVVLGVVILPWSLMLAYVAVVQPSMLKQQSDRRFVEQVTPKGEAPVYSYERPSGVRYFTLNFYLGDRMRSVADSTLFATMPSGTVVVYGDAADPGVFGPTWECSRLTDRASDYRNGLNMAVKQ